MGRRRGDLPPPSADVVIADAAAKLRAALVALEVNFEQQPGLPDAVRVPIYAGTLAAIAEVIIGNLGPEGAMIAADARTRVTARMLGW